MTSPPDYDLIIVGGGMAGATLAVALAGTGIRIAVIEAVSPRATEQPSYDDRGLALSLSSQRVLTGLGLWDAISQTANPVEHVHVSDQHHFGFVRLHANDLSVPALGHVVLARELGHVLMDRVNTTNNIDFICPALVEAITINPDHAELALRANGNIKTLSARLVVAADGSHSPVRDLLGIKTIHKDYGQTAIVTNVTPGHPHGNVAYERFTRQGPLAVLPLSDQRCAVVFTVNTADAHHHMTMSDEHFLAELQNRFGRRLGRFLRLGTRKSYVMQSITAQEQVRDRVVILGNAAHTIHPNGAQGFNLCLRDIAGLVEILVPAICLGEDLGEGILLNRYRDLRLPDQLKVQKFTDGLAGLFYNDLSHKTMLRNTGMLLLDMCVPLKRSFTRRAMGLYGRQPELVRGIPLCQ